MDHPLRNLFKNKIASTCLFIRSPKSVFILMREQSVVHLFKCRSIQLFFHLNKGTSINSSIFKPGASISSFFLNKEAFTSSHIFTPKVIEKH